MLDLLPANYPPTQPEFLTNMGFSLTPFTVLGVSGYTLHQTHQAPLVHAPAAIQALPKRLGGERSSLSQTKVTHFELERFLARADQCDCKDRFVMAKLAMNGLLSHPKDVWDVCCNYENRHVQLCLECMQAVAKYQETIAALEKEIYTVS